MSKTTSRLILSADGGVTTPTRGARFCFGSTFTAVTARSLAAGLSFCGVHRMSTPCRSGDRPAEGFRRWRCWAAMERRRSPRLRPAPDAPSGGSASGDVGARHPDRPRRAARPGSVWSAIVCGGVRDRRVAAIRVATSGPWHNPGSVVNEFGARGPRSLHARDVVRRDPPRRRLLIVIGLFRAARVRRPCAARLVRYRDARCRAERRCRGTSGIYVLAPFNAQHVSRSISSFLARSDLRERRGRDRVDGLLGRGVFPGERAPIAPLTNNPRGSSHPRVEVVAAGRSGE